VPLLSLADDLESGPDGGTSSDAPSMMVGLTQYDISLNPDYRCMEAAALAELIPAELARFETEILSIEVPPGCCRPNVVMNRPRAMGKMASIGDIKYETDDQKHDANEPPTTADL
jgi:hypothetical protein